MDPFHNWPLNEIIHFLKSALSLAEYEFQRNTEAVEDKEPLQDEDAVEEKEPLQDGGWDEDTNAPSPRFLKNTPLDKRNTLKNPQPQHGMFNLPLHYTMGRGVPEALGDDMDAVVFRAFRAASGAGNPHILNHHEIDLENVGIATEMWWDKYGRCVYLHLELVHTDDSIWMEENRGDIIGEAPPERSLN